MDVFLSHNRADKDTARLLGAQLTLAGAYVWYDDWEVAAGDSIPAMVNKALDRVDTAAILWSSNASRSTWVRAELEAALVRSLSGDGCRIIPVVLDPTPLPSLIAAIKHVDLSDQDVFRAVNEIMGFANDQQRLLAIQETLDEAGIDIQHFHGYGPVVCCPRCGANVDKLQGWSQVDESRDDLYAGFQCTVCHHTDGGEIRH